MIEILRLEVSEANQQESWTIHLFVRTMSWVKTQCILCTLSGRRMGKILRAVIRYIENSSRRLLMWAKLRFFATRPTASGWGWWGAARGWNQMSYVSAQIYEPR